MTIASKEKRIWNVNVDGTRNVVDFCERYSVDRLVHIASVHAIPEAMLRHFQKEPEVLSASLVEGVYGKSKAKAELGFCPRPIEQTLEDTVKWIKSVNSYRQRGKL